MKKRTDFVSNSSSSSFVICNGSEMLDKDDGHLMMLLSQTLYMHFIDVDYGTTLADYNKFKKELVKVFGSKVNVSFEHQDSEDSPPEDVYVEFEDDFYKYPTAKKRSLLERLIRNSESMFLNFGIDYEGGTVIATQIATLLDYLYDADIQSDDHFEYSPLKDIGITRKWKNENKK